MVTLYVIQTEAFECGVPRAAVGTHELKPMGPHVSFPVLLLDHFRAPRADALMFVQPLVHCSLLRRWSGRAVLSMLGRAVGAGWSDLFETLSDYKEKSLAMPEATIETVRRLTMAEQERSCLPAVFIGGGWVIESDKSA